MKWDPEIGRQRKNIDDRRFDDPAKDSDYLLATLPHSDQEFEARLQRLREFEAYKQRAGGQQPAPAPQPQDSFAKVRELAGAPQPPQQQSRVQLVGETDQELLYRDHTGREIRIPKSIVSK